MGYYAQTLADTREVAHSRWGYRNAAPYGSSPYRRTFATALNYDARNVNAEVEIGASNSMAVTNVTNRLHAGFGKRLGESSSFGATLTAEAKETFSMLSGTVLRLARAARCVKRLDLAGCARELGLPYRERTVKYTRDVGERIVRGRKYPARRIKLRKRVFKLPTGREVEKTLANGWLFWSYGVKPLASDIYNGLDVLQRPLAFEQPVRAYASDGGNRVEIFGGPGTSYYQTVTTWSGTVRGACGALVSVSNPNHYLLNKMGLANPAQWVLEAIPFSFVVDWFSNLSQVVGQFNEYLGYSIRDSWMSMQYKVKRSWYSASPWSSPYTFDGFVFTRTLGLPTPKLVFAYERFGVERALNAISLLVGFLPSRR